MATATKSQTNSVQKRIASLDWPRIKSELDNKGCATIGPFLTPEQCGVLMNAYDKLYRNRIIIAKHGFGRGEYKYFAYPLPPVITELREALYPHLAEVANCWNEEM